MARLRSLLRLRAPRHGIGVTPGGSPPLLTLRCGRRHPGCGSDAPRGSVRKAAAGGGKGYCFLHGFRKGLANLMGLGGNAADTHAECSPPLLHGAGTARKWLLPDLYGSDVCEGAHVEPTLRSLSSANPFPSPVWGFLGCSSTSVTRSAFCRDLK